MADFTLDTTGHVDIGPSVPPHLPGRTATLRLRWSDLDAFPQGYVEALFAENCDPVAVLTPEDDFSRRWDEALDRPLPRDVGFGHLAPETLAAILEDCAAYGAYYRGTTPAENGGHFWRNRQAGHLHHVANCGDFPPLAITLGDDGKVYLKEAAR